MKGKSISKSLNDINFKKEDSVNDLNSKFKIIIQITILYLLISHRYRLKSCCTNVFFKIVKYRE